MFKIPDLRKRIVFTLLMFGVYRLGAAVPVPGVDLDAVQRLTESGTQAGIYGLLNLFSGGALETFSVFALGIMPYITASIILQLLTVVIPRLQKLQEEGESGRKIITQWTRYVTVVLALLQSTGLTYIFSRGSLTGGISLIPNYTPSRVGLIVLTMTAGTAFIMWLGELISQRGIGNGMSLIIFASIVSQLPASFGGAYQVTAGQGRMGQLCSLVRANGRLGRHETNSNHNRYGWMHHWFRCRCDVDSTKSNRIQGRLPLAGFIDDWTIVDAFQNASNHD